MKKYLLLVASLCLGVFSQHAAAKDFKEGTHYTVVGQTASATPQVQEFFSYYCPHCYSFEPLVADLKSKLPADATFKKSHVPFIGKELGPVMQRAYASAVLLKAEDKMSAVIFSQLHDKKQFPQDEAAVQQLFIDNGIAEQDISDAMKSFSTQNMAQQFSRDTQTYNIRGVPAFIINGRYMVNTQSLTSQQEFNDLVLMLLQKK